jgi:hypothetical protein
MIYPNAHLGTLWYRSYFWMSVIGYAFGLFFAEIAVVLMQTGQVRVRRPRKCVTCRCSNLVRCRLICHVARVIVPGTVYLGSSGDAGTSARRFAEDVGWL